MLLEEENDEALISEEDISSFGKSQLAEKLEELLKSDDIVSMTSVTRIVRDRFEELKKEEHDFRLKLFLQEGGLEEDFSPIVDPLDKKIDSLYKSINRKKTEHREQKEKSAIENLSTKKIIIEELKELLKGEGNFSKAYNKFQAIQSKWRSTGDVPAIESRTLKENYNFLVGKFYEIIKISNELRELDRKKNLELKTELCARAEQLAVEPSLKKALEGLQILQESWKEAGFISRDLNEQLGLRFKTAADQVFQRKKEHAAIVKTQQEANLAGKQELCGQMEALAGLELNSLKSCRDASEKLELIWSEWQKIGFVPKSDQGHCWKRFKKARQNVFESLDGFYNKQRHEFETNLQKKTELCLKAESLQDSLDFSVTADLLKKMQVEWKSTGPVSRKDSDKIWTRFRTACDHFFEKRNLAFEAKEKDLRINVQAKEAVILKMESLSPVEDNTINLDELKKIEDEWSIPLDIPVREKDRLNNSFGNAVDAFLEKIKSGSGLDQKVFYRLKYEQMLKSAAGQEKLKKMRQDIQNKLGRLQSEINQLENNLGFFNKSKKANPLLTEYEQKLENSKQEARELNLRLKAIPVIQ